VIRAIALIVAFAAVARADVYRFDGGTTLAAHPGMPRCDGGKNITNWTTESTLELGPKSATLRLSGTPYAADAIAGTWYTFHTSPRHTVVVHVDPFACTDASCRDGMRATFSVIRHPDTAPSAWTSADTCYETWAGLAHRSAS
jgi:hypothetical protein